jgi:hypothetical protein
MVGRRSAGGSSVSCSTHGVYPPSRCRWPAPRAGPSAVTPARPGPDVQPDSVGPCARRAGDCPRRAGPPAPRPARRARAGTALSCRSRAAPSPGSAARMPIPVSADGPGCVHVGGCPRATCCGLPEAYTGGGGRARGSAHRAGPSGLAGGPTPRVRRPPAGNARPWLAATGGRAGAVAGPGPRRNALHGLCGLRSGLRRSQRHGRGRPRLALTAHLAVSGHRGRLSTLPDALLGRARRRLRGPRCGRRRTTAVIGPASRPRWSDLGWLGRPSRVQRGRPLNAAGRGSRPARPRPCRAGEPQAVSVSAALLIAGRGRPSGIWPWASLRAHHRLVPTSAAHPPLRRRLGRVGPPDLRQCSGSGTWSRPASGGGRARADGGHLIAGRRLFCRPGRAAGRGRDGELVPPSCPADGRNAHRGSA